MLSIVCCFGRAQTLHIFLQNGSRDFGDFLISTLVQRMHDFSMGHFMNLWLWLEAFAFCPHTSGNYIVANKKFFKDRSDEMWCCFHRKSNGVGLEPMSNIQMVGPASLFSLAILHLRWNDCCIQICFYGLDRHGRKAPMFRLASLLVLLAVSGAVLAVFQILRPGVYHCWVSLCFAWKVTGDLQL